MASMEYSPFTLRLFVDKERNRVVVAEASSGFVDTLFSLLTLPLGTIIRLTSENQPPSEIGCINNLYNSVKDCDIQDFFNEVCKKMLLCPRNPCEKLCQQLKLNVDDTQTTKHWMCGSCVRNKKSDLWISSFVGVSCPCGKVMEEDKLWEEDSFEGTAQMDGVFVKKDAIYLVFDDLRVIENSIANAVEQLLQLGYTDVNWLTEMSQDIGSKEELVLGCFSSADIYPFISIILGMEEKINLVWNKYSCVDFVVSEDTSLI